MRSAWCEGWAGGGGEPAPSLGVLLGLGHGAVLPCPGGGGFLCCRLLPLHGEISVLGAQWCLRRLCSRQPRAVVRVAHEAVSGTRLPHIHSKNGPGTHPTPRLRPTTDVQDDHRDLEARLVQHEEPASRGPPTGAAPPGSAEPGTARFLLVFGGILIPADVVPAQFLVFFLGGISVRAAVVFRSGPNQVYI